MTEAVGNFEGLLREVAHFQAGAQTHFASIPRKRSGAIEAISSAVLAPNEVPITTACSIPRWSIRATTCSPKMLIE